MCIDVEKICQLKFIMIWHLRLNSHILPKKLRSLFFIKKNDSFISNDLIAATIDFLIFIKATMIMKYSVKYPKISNILLFYQNLI